jgi:hypothetical protein
MLFQDAGLDALHMPSVDHHALLQLEVYDRDGISQGTCVAKVGVAYDQDLLGQALEAQVLGSSCPYHHWWTKAQPAQGGPASKMMYHLCAGMLIKTTHVSRWRPINAKEASGLLKSWNVGVPAILQGEKLARQKNAEPECRWNYVSVKMKKQHE